MNHSAANLARLSLEQRTRLEQRLLTRAAAPPAVYSRSDGAAKPLTFAQESIWYFDRLVPGSALYNIPLAFRLFGPLNRTALFQAFQSLIARHEALRLRFVESDGTPLQVASLREIGIGFRDLTSLDPEPRQVEMQRRLEIEARRPFQLQSDPLIRAELLQLGAEDHLFIISLHHIVADYASLEVLCHDLAELYDSAVAGQPSKLPALPISFSEWAASQRRFGESHAASKHLSYWQSRLGGSLPVLDMPTDQPRPLSSSFDGARRPVQIVPALSSALRRISQVEGVTLYMLLLAAWQTLLHRYSGQEDVLIGSPVAQRHQSGVQGMIGLFLNTVVLRAAFSGNPTFRQVLQRTRASVVGAFAHQELPFEKLVEKLQLPRGSGRNPVFQSMFQYLSSTWPRPRFAELETQVQEMETATAKFELTLTLRESGDGLTGDLEYSTELFRAATIDRLLANFGVLLEGIKTNPDVAIGRLPLLTSAERYQVTELWNRTETNYPRESPIAELFEQKVAENPEAIALSSPSLSVSYAELNRRANQLAHHLIDSGVQPRDRVGICLPRSPEAIVALLAVVKAGAAYVPTDPKWPIPRLAHVLGDAGVSRVLTTTPFQHHCGGVSSVTLLDGEQSVIAQRPSANLGKRATAEDLAYVMYTSGSTGEPKGVAIPQRGVVRLVRDTNYARFDRGEVFLQLAPLAFDASTFEIWGALLNGAKLVLYPSEFESLEQLSQVLRETGVTTLWLTAGLFHEVVDLHPDCLTGLRQLLAGGDVLSVPHVLKALRHLPNGQLINGYGPTENTTFSCCFRFPPDWPGTEPAPIGRPISNTQVFILDPELAPVPIGVVGELCLAGDGLAQSYWNSPNLTEQTFVPHPFPTQPGERLFRTGDKARFRSDGTIEFLGRKDDQVKINGFRIHLAEVEAALQSLPQVRQAVVVAHQVDEGSKRLAAYIVPETGGAVTATQLREALARTLPGYMIPHRFALVDALPITPNGKVDRKALPALEDTTNDAPPTVVPDQTESPLHREIAATWQEAFGRDTIGLDDNFFELGGHSLLATRIISRLNHKLQANLSLASLFQAPTVRTLAEKIQAAGQPSLTSPIIRRRTGRSAAPAMANLDQLSEVEIDALLQARSQG